jgi:hypothetical protein
VADVTTKPLTDAAVRIPAVHWADAVVVAEPSLLHRRPNEEALEQPGQRQPLAASVVSLFGGSLAGAAAYGSDQRQPTNEAASALGSNSISLPKPRESTAYPRICEEVSSDRNPPICRDFL